MRKALIAAGTLIAAVLTGRWLFRPREDIDWRDADRPGRIAIVDGVGIHYLDRGSGPAVVLIHGYGGETFSFRYLIPDLARDHRVVAVDLQGFGYSERPQKGDYSLSSQVQLVVHLMDALDIKRAVVLGHSMGGEVAMRIAAGWPDRVERLILAASISGDRFPSLPVLPVLKPFLRLFTRLFGRRIFKRMFYDERHATEDALQAYRAPGRIRGSSDTAYAVMRDVRKDKAVAFARITQPVLILWASRDRIVPGWALGRLRRRLPQARVSEIARSGHLLLEEQPDACNGAIRDFLTLGQADASPDRHAVDIAQPAS